MDFESKVSILEVDSLDQILIRIFRIHDPCVSFRNGSEKNTFGKRSSDENQKDPAMSAQGKCYFLVKWRRNVLKMSY